MQGRQACQRLIGYPPEKSAHDRLERVAKIYCPAAVLATLRQKRNRQLQRSGSSMLVLRFVPERWLFLCRLHQVPVGLLIHKAPFWGWQSQAELYRLLCFAWPYRTESVFCSLGQVFLWRSLVVGRIYLM